jgi:hypothetical protein
MTDLNPQIVEMSVGTRTLRKIVIYPLSMADQFKMTKAIVGAFSSFTQFDREDMKDEDVVASMVPLIEENIEQILEFVLDKEEKVTMDELTNDQFTDICLTVFETNYEGSVKKIQDLVGRIKGILPGPIAPQPVVEPDLQ